MLGEIYLNKALKTEKTFCFWNKNKNKENASELFEKSGDCFSREEKFEQSIFSYTKAIDCYTYNENYLSCGKCYEKIGNLLYKKEHDLDSCVEKYLLAIEFYLKALNFLYPAKLYNKIANLYEKEYKYETCINYLIRSIDNYEMGNFNAVTIFNLQTKIAEMYIKIGKHTDSILWYEKTLHYIDNCLLKYKIIENIFMIISCKIFLCLNDVYEIPNIQKYIDEYIIFRHSRECLFVSSLIEMLKNRDIEELNILYEKYSNLFLFHTIREKLFFDIKIKLENDFPQENFK
jgi:tetratricopeptide (TPR) repeat protein